MRRILEICIFLFIGLVAGYGQIQVDIIPDTNRMLIGDQQLLTISVTCDPSIQAIEIDLDSISSVSGFEILREDEWQERTTQMSRILTKEILFTAFEPGEFQFPELPYSFQFNGKDRQGKTKAWDLTVIPVNTNSQELEDIKDIVETKPIPIWVWALMAIFALLLIGGLIYLLYKLLSRKGTKVLKIQKNIQSPEDEALDALKALNNSKLWELDDQIPFQTELSNIIRQFLSRKFRMHSLTSSTTEILNDIKVAELSPGWIRTIDQALHLADFVKFAKGHTRTELNLSVLKGIEDIVSDIKNRANQKKILDEGS